MSDLEDLAAIGPKQIWDGVTARVVEGERITLSVVELEAGSVVPLHEHDNEQIGLVIEGSVTFTVGDERRDLRAGGTWRILGGTPHEVKAGPEGAVVIEAFSPVRSDWGSIEAQPARAPRWPVDA